LSTVAVLLGVVHFGLIVVGLSDSGYISSVAIASPLYVPFSAALAGLVLAETLGWARALGIVLALGDVWLRGDEHTWELAVGGLMTLGSVATVHRQRGS
jgi:O-acetylserine/cysteine efflux transporter